MPKYFEFKVAGYYLYFTSACTLECMHAHASDGKLSEAGSAKLFVKDNGDTVIQHQGTVSDKDMRIIRSFVKEYYKQMYSKWVLYSTNGYYRGN